MVKETKTESNGKKYKYIFIQFSVSEDEKKQIETITDECHKSSMSEFVRDAVFEKISHIRHPELYQNNNSIPSFNPAILEQIVQQNKDLLRKQEILIENSKLLTEMNRTLELINKYSQNTDLKEEKQIVINLLKAHIELSQKQISDRTKLSEDVVFTILSDTSVFKANITGRFSLK